MFVEKTLECGVGKCTNFTDVFFNLFLVGGGAGVMGAVVGRCF